MDYYIAYNSRTGNTAMLTEKPEALNFKNMINNFDRAASHPDMSDLESLRKKIKEIFPNEYQ